MARPRPCASRDSTRRASSARVARLEPMQRLVDWCAESEVDDALIGGFYVRAEQRPLGELRIDGERARLARVRSALGQDAGVRARPRRRGRACARASSSRSEPGGDLLQAGPMLLRGGISLVEPGSDPEGFSSGSRQFDSDITAGRYPRAALGIGRTRADRGRLRGARGSRGRPDHRRAGVRDGEPRRDRRDQPRRRRFGFAGDRRRLVNTPREEHGIEIPGGRAVTTALRFDAR